MVEQARLEATDSGLTPVTEGWFVVNVRDAAWLTNDAFGAACILEGDDAPFGDVGFTLDVVWPGQPSGLYHSESNQEDFLVLAGECVLLVEGEAEHIFVGAGAGPCVIFMTGGRCREKRVVYPRSELARRHGAGVETETDTPSEAYSTFPQWQQARPEGWAGLPWA